MSLVYLAWQAACCAAVPRLWRIVAEQTTHYFPSLAKKSPGRQQYVVKNLAKAGVLMFLSPPALWTMNRIVFSNAWEAPLIRCMGAMYAASDLVALLTMFEKLPATTKCHHLCVAGFSVINACIVDYEDPASIWRHTAMLAACSAPTYGVNAYLGLRCLDEVNESEKRRLAGFCLSVYTFFVTLSVAWQTVSLWFTYPYWDATTPFYLGAVALIYWDDFYLSQYLLLHSNCRRK